MILPSFTGGRASSRLIDHAIQWICAAHLSWGCNIVVSQRLADHEEHPPCIDSWRIVLASVRS